MKTKKKVDMYPEKKCQRCGNLFNANIMIKNDNVCRTCNRLNDIPFWYPVLLRSGIPTPETFILYTNINLEPLAFGEAVEGIDTLITDIQNACKKVGSPSFLRTGHSSNKHEWENSCFISKETSKDKKKLLNHVHNLVEHSTMMTIDRFTPCDFWAVRKFIETEIFFYDFDGKMPITKERRFFIDRGKIQCSHSYWPKKVFLDKSEKQVDELNNFSKQDVETMVSMAKYIAGKFSGLWSVDFLKGKDGTWYCIDMAIGERSYHEEYK